ncbi:hypothetical protein O1E22_003421 [Vibrio cholerae]|nr:hypothetical protein [Vibrio cholerae]
MKKVLIGESSWDSECFEKCIGKPDKTYLHNDFFYTSNKRNTKNLNRLIVLFKTLFIALKAIVQKNELYFSSLNFEVISIACLVSWYNKSFVFLPNTIGKASAYNGSFNNLMRKYTSRVYTSDKISEINLEEFYTLKPKLQFDFEVPKKHIIKKLKYIVAFPAAMSHKATKDNSSYLYQFSTNLAEILQSYELDVYVLPHPRDRDYSNFELSGVKLITPNEIASFGDDVCYISASSSLSLNRRYGGLYGCWVAIDGNNGLPDSLDEQRSILLDVSYFNVKNYM